LLHRQLQTRGEMRGRLSLNGARVRRLLIAVDHASYNDVLSSPELELSIVAARLERTTHSAAFLTQLRREVDALPVRSEIIAVPADSRGFGHELRSGLWQLILAFRKPAR
jgi:hypothetical protein